MSNFRPPANPRVARPVRVSDFEGIADTGELVIQQRNARGWDVSNHFANDMYDLDCVVAGMARLRRGKRKINNTGKAGTVTAFIMINLGGKKRYGFVWDGQLDAVDIPDYTVKLLDPVVLSPEPTRDAVASEYPILDPSDWT